MSLATKWPRLMVVVGLAAMIVGAVDPLEGSIIILPGLALVALGAQLGHSRYRVLLHSSLALVAVGVGALWGISAVGGLGGTTGRSYWWALVLIPYPAGWLMGLVGAARQLRERVAAV